MPRRAATSRRPAARPTRKTNRQPVTPETILEFQLVGDPQISPDGSKILFTKKHIENNFKSVANIYCVDTKTGETAQFTSGGKDGGARWSPDGKSIAFTSGREKPNAQIFLISANGGEAKALTKFPEGSIAGYKWSPDGKSLAVSFRESDPDWTTKATKKREEEGRSTPPRVLDNCWYRLDGDGYFNNQRHHLYVVDVATGQHKKVFDKDLLGWFDFDWSPNSKEIAIATNLDKQPMHKPYLSRIYRLNVATKKLTLIPNQTDGGKDAVQWSPDGKKIAYTGVEGREDLWSGKNDSLFVMDANSGRPKNLTGSEDYCVAAATLSDTRDAGFGSNFRWSPDSKKIILGIGWHGETHLATIPITGGKIKFLTSGQREHMLGNLSSDGKLVALCCGDSQNLNEVFIGTMSASDVKVKQLTSFNKKLLDTLELAKSESHWVTSSDGWKTQVWVMKPANMKPGTKAPAVLEIHGGPHAQYGVPFFHEFQMLAAKGYVVFYSNPRGSKGYGEQHTNSIAGDWGNKDWLDVQAVIAFMKSRPYVNAQKMGVMGGSYGGYMTNWVIGHTNEFAGAITDRCVSNLVSMAGNSDFPFMPDRYWKGNPWDKPEALWNSSPIKYFGNVKTPTLIIHSEGDLRCNIEQSEQVFSILQVRGIPSRFVRYPASTSHGMSRSGPPDLRIHRLNQILEWWATYLQPRRKK